MSGVGRLLLLQMVVWIQLVHNLIGDLQHKRLLPITRYSAGIRIRYHHGPRGAGLLVVHTLAPVFN